jgi:hypothetical protein
MYGGIELSVPLRLAVKAFLLCFFKLAGFITASQALYPKIVT